MNDESLTFHCISGVGTWSKLSDYTFQHFDRPGAPIHCFRNPSLTCTLWFIWFITYTCQNCFFLSINTIKCLYLSFCLKKQDIILSNVRFISYSKCSNWRWIPKLSSNFECLFTFWYLDGANSIKTDLHICT